MQSQFSELGPLKTKMPDFAISQGVASKDTVNDLLSKSDTLPMAPEYAYFQQ